MKRISKSKVISGSTIAIIGYILSPLSWWNDVIVNIPISYAIAFLFSLFNKNLFPLVFGISYFITNITGFILMHLGVEIAVKGMPKISRKSLIKYLIISSVYTLVAAYIANLSFNLLLKNIIP